MRVLTVVTLLLAAVSFSIIVRSVQRRDGSDKSEVRYANCARGMNSSETFRPTILTSKSGAGKVDKSSIHAVDYAAVWMRPSEIDTAIRYLCDVNTYLEWGSGGSTLNFAPFARRVAHSIEHNTEWCKTLQDGLSRCANCDRVHYHCVPVAKGYRNWNLNSHTDEGTYHQFDTYVDKVDDLGERSFDFVLIDGRARVAAAIKTLAYVSSGSRVVLHDASRIDGTKERSNYGPVKTYYDFEELVLGEGMPGIAVLRRKPEWSFLEGNVSAVNALLMELPTL